MNEELKPIIMENSNDNLTLPEKSTLTSKALKNAVEIKKKLSGLSKNKSAQYLMDTGLWRDYIMKYDDLDKQLSKIRNCGNSKNIA